MKKIYFPIVFSLILIFDKTAAVVICYHGTWSHYRSGNGNFPISLTPTDLCTHYIYAFAGLDASTNQVVSLDSWLDFNLNGFQNAIALKQSNKDLKVLLAVGGYSQGSARFSNMAAHQSTRATFIQSALTFVQTHGFDGLDLDWEYPARRDGQAQDKENFALLVKELYEVFNPLGLILTSAVSAVHVDVSYDVPTLSQYLDYINLMLYDFHGFWDTHAYHNAPLYSTSKLAGTSSAGFSVNASVHQWIEAGASPSKLALGIPLYGRTAILSSASNTSPGAPTTSQGAHAGPYTGTVGFWGYNEIVEQFQNGDWTLEWDDEQEVPYAYKGTTWLTYDNGRSIGQKVEFANDLGLGGIMVWSIETDDAYGVSDIRFPLLKAIQNALDTSRPNSSTTSSVSSTTSSTAPVTSETTSSSQKTSTTTAAETTTTTTTPTSTTTQGKPSSDSRRIKDANSCVTEGFFGSSVDCSIYFYCQSVDNGHVGYSFMCSQGLVYDTTFGICNYPALVDCSN
ncbi:hypothetical protein ABEB36_002154 [Hypothenemus hampei]|uniref:chitinase n=1 Tax=Hypothenemus hampei TaxID=57062 RepID=A0ABD1F7B8_HYPHA